MRSKSIYTALAQYNQIMNEKVYSVASRLEYTDRKRDAGAFFSSIEGTLQHIFVADLIWMNRFSQSIDFTQAAKEFSFEFLKDFPRPEQLDQELFSEFESLWQARMKMDRILIAFTESLSEEMIFSDCQFKNMSGKTKLGPLWLFLTHVFNHQTHHRGQATTLLNQLGKDVGVTDFPYVLPQPE